MRFRGALRELKLTCEQVADWSSPRARPASVSFDCGNLSPYEGAVQRGDSSHCHVSFSDRFVSLTLGLFSAWWNSDPITGGQDDFGLDEDADYQWTVNVTRGDPSEILARRIQHWSLHFPPVFRLSSTLTERQRFTTKLNPLPPSHAVRKQQNLF